MYSTDLTDRQWSIIRKLLPRVTNKRTGRPRKWSLRAILNAIFYVLKTGCQWRLLPKDFPAWSSVYHYFREWRISGLWQKIHDVLRTAVREQAGKKPQPTAGIIDSQSVKTVQKGGVVVTTEAKKSRGVNDISSSTPLA